MSFFFLLLYTQIKCVSLNESLETIKKKKKKITTAAVFTFLQAWGGFLRYSVMSMSGLPKSILSFV